MQVVQPWVSILNSCRFAREESIVRFSSTTIIGLWPSAIEMAHGHELMHDCCETPSTARNRTLTRLAASGLGGDRVAAARGASGGAESRTLSGCAGVGLAVVERVATGCDWLARQHNGAARLPCNSRRTVILQVSRKNQFGNEPGIPMAGES